MPCFTWGDCSQIERIYAGVRPNFRKQTCLSLWFRPLNLFRDLIEKNRKVNLLTQRNSLSWIQLAMTNDKAGNAMNFSCLAGSWSRIQNLYKILPSVVDCTFFAWDSAVLPTYSFLHASKTRNAPFFNQLSPKKSSIADIWLPSEEKFVLCLLSIQKKVAPKRADGVPLFFGCQAGASDCAVDASSLAVWFTYLLYAMCMPGRSDDNLHSEREFWCCERNLLDIIAADGYGHGHGHGHGIFIFTISQKRKRTTMSHKTYLFTHKP